MDGGIIHLQSKWKRKRREEEDEEDEEEGIEGGRRL